MRGMSRVSKRGLELLVFQDMRVYTHIYICAYTHIYICIRGWLLLFFSHTVIRDPRLHAYVRGWISWPRYICGRGVYIKRGCGGNIRVSGAGSLCRYGEWILEDAIAVQEGRTPPTKDTFFRGHKAGICNVAPATRYDY